MKPKRRVRTRRPEAEPDDDVHFRPEDIAAILAIREEDFTPMTDAEIEAEIAGEDYEELMADPLESGDPEEPCGKKSLH